MYNLVQTIHAHTHTCTQILDDLQQVYGGDAYPTPPQGTTRGLIAGLMEVDPGIITSDAELLNILRDDVMQGPLAKVPINTSIYSILIEV